jgi:hypothetical protein
MNQSILLAAVCCALLLIVSVESWGQGQSCTVRIVTPADGGSVSETDDVKGAGTIPAGSYLWIFAHRKGLALWWPEGGGAATVTQGKWLVTATFGVERDNGRQFEIAAGVVDQSTNEKLMHWVSKTAETGQYPGISMPPTVQGCRLEQVTVTKSN